MPNKSSSFAEGLLKFEYSDIHVFITPSLPRSGGEGRGEEALIAPFYAYVIRDKTTLPHPSPAASSQEREKMGSVEMRPNFENPIL